MKACGVLLKVAVFVILLVALAADAKKKYKPDKTSLMTVTEDSIIIEADPTEMVQDEDPKTAEKKKPKKKSASSKTSSKSRSGRQFMFQQVFPQYIDYGPEEEIITAGMEPTFPGQGDLEQQMPRVGDICVTPDNREGICTRLKTCYKFMAGNDVDDDGFYEGNAELAGMIKENTQGSCQFGGFGGGSNFKNFGTSGGPPPTEQSFGGDQIDLVCCTGNVTIQDESEVGLRIVHGSEAPRGKYPYIVALMNNGYQFCGGSLLNSNHVLTAAHCVQHMNSHNINRITVQIGDHNIYSNRDGYSETRRAVRVVWHRYFNQQSLVNDVAVIKLASPVRFNRLIQPVPLATSTPSAGTAWVAGWGKVGEHRPATPVLQHVAVGVYSNARCQQVYRGYAQIANHMVCAGSSPRDSCNGDSGGPLMYNGRQIGIVSWGIGCGRFPGVYTRVASFLDWINRNKNL